VTASQVESLRASQSAFETRMARFESSSSAHMSEAVDLFKQQMAVQKEFINILKEQNRLLAKSNP